MIHTITEPFGVAAGRLSQPERAAAGLSAPPSPPRHRLDAPGARWVWLWPIGATDTEAEVTALCVNLVAHGITGLVPQESAKAIAWVRQWGTLVRSHGLDLVIGLGYLSAAIVCDAIAAAKAGHASGVMFDQEEWKSVPDSDALVRTALAQHPDAAEWCIDCFFPCLDALPSGGPIDLDAGHGHPGHAPIAKAWAPICGLRAPQCYWESKPLSFAPDGWVLRRLAWARKQYPKAGGSPASRVRASVQMYRRSVQDHVALLLAEGETGSVWLWDAREADASAWTGLAVVHALETRGYHGPDAVRAFQGVVGLTVDGVVGPRTCAALGVDVPDGGVWTHP